MDSIDGLHQTQQVGLVLISFNLAVGLKNESTKKWKTSMHSSRMRTPRLLTVSGEGGVGLCPGARVATIVYEAPKFTILGHCLIFV